MGGQKIILGGGHLPPLAPPWRRHCTRIKRPHPLQVLKAKPTKSGGLKAAFERVGEDNKELSNKECVNLDSDSSDR